MTRAFMILGLGVVFAMPVSAAPPAAEPVSWPDHGPYRTVGDPSYGLTRMPVPVAKAVYQVVGEEPSTWRSGVLPDSVGLRGRIVQVLSEKQDVSLLVERGRWVILSAPGSVAFLNDALAPRSAAAVRDVGELEDYLQNIIFLHYGGAHLLTKEYPPGPGAPEYETGTYVDCWLKGSEKRPRALLALQRNPTVSRGKEPDEVIVRGNVVKWDGSVERWSFHLRLGKVVTLVGIDIVQLRKPGTFTPGL